MLILAGVSLNAIIGDNGIINSAQSTTIKNSIAILEEFLQEKYLEVAEQNTESFMKIQSMLNAYPEYFYTPEDTGLQYLILNGQLYFLINKDNLPEDIKSQLLGGDANTKTYYDYTNFKDVYGVTSNLNVYYCSDGLGSLIGKGENLKDSGDRKAINSGSTLGSYLKTTFPEEIKTDETGNVLADGLALYDTLTLDSCTVDTLEDIYNFSAITQLTIINANIKNLNGISKAPLLRTIFIQNSTIEDYSEIGIASNIKTLTFNYAKSGEFDKFCRDMEKAKSSSLERLNLTQGYSIGNSINKINDISAKMKSGLKYFTWYHVGVYNFELGDGFTSLYELVCQNGWDVRLKTIKLGNLPNLTYLYSYHARILNSFEIESCPKLYYFAFYSNETLKSLSFPSTPNLSYLILSGYNNSTDYICRDLQSVTLDNVSSLININARGCSKLEVINGLTSVANLQTCDLFMTKFPNINFLSGCNKLTYLDITGIPIDNLNILSTNATLTTLIISKTNIGKNTDSEKVLNNATNVEEIKIKNKNSTNVLASVLSNKANLTNFQAEYCDWLVYPSYLKENKNLTILKLKGSNRILSSELEILKNNLTKVDDYTLPEGNDFSLVNSYSKKFILNDATITLTDFNKLASCTSLTTLGLYNVKITNNGVELTEAEYNTNVKNVLENLTNLQYLALRINKLSEITFVQSLSQLEYIDLIDTNVGTSNNNGLKQLNSYCNNLSTLGITSKITCDFSTIQPAISKVRVVDGGCGGLTQKRIYGITCDSTSSWSTLSSCTSLVNLYIRGGNVPCTTFDLSGCKTLNNVYYLYGGDPYFKPPTWKLPDTLEAGNDGYSFTMTSMYNTSDYPVYINGGKGCKNLSIGFSSGNASNTGWLAGFNRVLSCFSGSTMLKNFYIDDYASAYYDATTLTTLISSFSNLEEFSYSTDKGQGLSNLNCLSGLKKLRKITVSGGNIKGLPNMQLLTNLEEISIKSSTLSSIDNLSTLPNKEKIKSLIFSGNSLYDLTEISNLTNLETLNVENNKIETLKNTYNHGDVYNAVILNTLRDTYEKLVNLYIAGNRLDSDAIRSLDWALSK